MMLEFLAANPGVAISGGLLLAGSSVSILLLLLMRRAGQSPRPVAFFLGFFLIVVLPQFVYHLSQARWTGDAPPAASPYPSSSHSPAPAATWEADWAHDHGRFLHPGRLFGPRAERELILDARPVFPAMLGAAQAAQMAMFPSGNSLLAARFTTPDQAAQALRAYLEQFGVAMAGGDLAQGVVVRRGTVGDQARLRLTGPLLMVWTAPDAAALAAFTDGWEPPSGAALSADSAEPVVTGNVYIDPRLKQPGMWLFLLANLAAAVLFFFKGATWAARVPAPAGAAPLSAAELSTRLLAVNGTEVPMQVSPDPDGRALTVDWRIADARWLDLARAHRLRRQFRLVLDLDEARHIVRVREYWRQLDASLGADGARVAWRMARGITFFQYQHERVFGLQFDAAGRPQPNLSYAYTFNLQELRQPFMQAVAQAGWHWQPVLLAGPPGLRWLTG